MDTMLATTRMIPGVTYQLDAINDEEYMQDGLETSADEHAASEEDDETTNQGEDEE